jgi:hypothetical protein
MLVAVEFLDGEQSRKLAPVEHAPLPVNHCELHCVAADFRNLEVQHPTKPALDLVHQTRRHISYSIG